MLIYFSVSGIFLSLILLYFNIKKYPSSIYLGFFFLFIGLYGITQHAVLYSNSIFLISIFFTNLVFLSYLIGPMLYWYIRSVVSDKSRLTIKDLWHFLPMLIYLVAELPYLFSSYSYKQQIARIIADDSSYLMTYKATFLSDLFGNAVLYLSRPVLILAYTIFSFWIFIRYLLKKKEKSVFTKQTFMIKWIFIFLGFQLILILSQLIALFQTFILNFPNLFYSINVLQGLSAVGLIGLLISPLFFPRILYGLPNYSAIIDKGEAEKLEIPSFSSTIVKSVNNFEEDYLFQVKQKIEVLMQKQEPFLHPNFNLSQCSVLIEVPVHHLAYFFREIKKQSFNDFRNECRINYAKKILINGGNSGLTLEAIAINSGFLTRNTFFKAFKKVEGISPSAFVSTLQA